MIISKDITYDEKSYPVKYSFCTLVTRKDQYQEMLETILNAGFDENNSEVLYFEAEKGIHYDLIDQVLKTAASAGFTKFRLAVSRKV